MGFDYLDIDSTTGNVPTGRVGDLVVYPDSATAYPGQGRLDFTPSGSELAHALRKRETKAGRILDRLKQGPATSLTLALITHRFSARILELRRAGHKISREDHVHEGSEWSTYTLEGE